MTVKYISFPDCIKKSYAYAFSHDKEYVKVVFSGVTEEDVLCVQHWFKLASSLKKLWKGKYALLFSHGIDNYNVISIDIRKQFLRTTYKVVLRTLLMESKDLNLYNDSVMAAALFILHEIEKYLPHDDGSRTINIPYADIEEHADGFSFLINSGYFEQFYLCGCHVTFSIKEEMYKKFRKEVDNVLSIKKECNGKTEKNLSLEDVSQTLS